MNLPYGAGNQATLNLRNFNKSHFTQKEPKVSCPHTTHDHLLNWCSNRCLWALIGLNCPNRSYLEPSTSHNPGRPLNMSHPLAVPGTVDRPISSTWLCLAEILWNCTAVGEDSALPEHHCVPDCPSLWSSSLPAIPQQKKKYIIIFLSITFSKLSSERDGRN